MKKTRYDVSEMVETQWEPSSRGKVLRNRLGIRSKREMDLVETREQIRALDKLVGVYGKNHRFITEDVRRIHKIWLAPIYDWAGEYRQVNLSKSGFPFAAAGQISKLMAEFEKGPLRIYTPCLFSHQADMTKALAVVHTELLLIHPFREGNGRTARILAVLMSLQAGLPPLDFSGIKGRNRQAYFAVVRNGLERNYAPMENIFSEIVQRTLKRYGGQTFRKKFHSTF